MLCQVPRTGGDVEKLGNVIRQSHTTRRVTEKTGGRQNKAGSHPIIHQHPQGQTPDRSTKTQSAGKSRKHRAPSKEKGVGEDTGQLKEGRKIDFYTPEQAFATSPAHIPLR